MSLAFPSFWIVIGEAGRPAARHHLGDRLVVTRVVVDVVPDERAAIPHQQIRPSVDRRRLGAVPHGGDVRLALFLASSVLVPATTIFPPGAIATPPGEVCAPPNGPVPKDVNTVPSPPKVGSSWPVLV